MPQGILKYLKTNLSPDDVSDYVSDDVSPPHDLVHTEGIPSINQNMRPNYANLASDNQQCRTISSI